MDHHLIRAAEQAPALTYGGAGVAFTIWGLHLSDLAAIIAAFSSLMGVSLQFYLVMHRVRRLERGQDAQRVVVKAVAKSQRAVAEKVDNIEKSGDQGGI